MGGGTAGACVCAGRVPGSVCRPRSSALCCAVDPCAIAPCCCDAWSRERASSSIAAARERRAFEPAYGGHRLRSFGRLALDAAEDFDVASKLDRRVRARVLVAALVFEYV